MTGARSEEGGALPRYPTYLRPCLTMSEIDLVYADMVLPERQTSTNSSISYEPSGTDSWSQLRDVQY
eukprot:3913119-Rhodomonas_salina.4